MTLSSGLLLSDLSDYLAPSQICIKPIQEDNSQPISATTNQQNGDLASVPQVQIEQGSSQSTSSGWKSGSVVVEEDSSVGTSKKLKKAQITLNDCLACSGCITSAESVLVQLQSSDEVLQTLLTRPDLTPILSVSPQSLASLATFHQITTSTTLARLRKFFKRKLGFKLVFDTTFARELSSIESRHEFTQRYKNTSSSPASRLPILASSCPGWICYAEKTHGELLPFISAVKSPQQVQGSLVKTQIARQLGLEPTKIYHVTVMPCYDKKLEASRPDFVIEGAVEGEVGFRHVDCVLTTAEVQKMMEAEGYDMQGVPYDNDDLGQAERQFMPDSLPPRGSSSGGALHDIIQHVTSLLSPAEASQFSVRVNARRGSDYTDYTIHIADSPRPIFKGALCYGFRNLQNVVRKIGRESGVAVSRGAAGVSTGSGIALRGGGGKSAAAKAAAARRAARRGAKQAVADDAGTGDTAGDDERAYDYVEVMACPSGCVNGGGQVVDVGVESTTMSARGWVSRVEQTYWSGGSDGGDDDDVAQRVWDAMGSDERAVVLRTAYRAVEAGHVNGLAVTW